MPNELTASRALEIMRTRSHTRRHSLIYKERNAARKLTQWSYIYCSPVRMAHSSRALGLLLTELTERSRRHVITR